MFVQKVYEGGNFQMSLSHEDLKLLSMSPQGANVKTEDERYAANHEISL